MNLIPSNVKKVKILFLAISAVSMLLLISAVGWGSDWDFINLKTKVNALDAQVNGNFGRDGLVSSVEELKNLDLTVNRLKAQVSSLESQVAHLELQAVQKESQVDESRTIILESHIRSLENRVSTLESQVKNRKKIK